LNNRITNIGLHAFSAKARLFALSEINIAFNNLTTLEPWPFIRGQLVPNSVVNLHRNPISVFTNELEWSFRCGMKPFFMMSLDMSYNEMKHLTDLLDGWNITGTVYNLDVC
jgi:hypothetical protein